MKLILPVIIQEVDQSLNLPLFIYETDTKITTYLEQFSIEEKEQLFKIKIHQLDSSGRGMTYQHIGATIQSLNLDLKFQQYLFTPYKITISKETDNPSLLQKEKDIIDFVLKIILGSELPVSIITDTQTMFNNSLGTAGVEQNSRRENRIINNTSLDRIKRLIQVLHTNQRATSIELLKSLLSVALTSSSLGVSGAFYISVLESLYVPDKDAEIGYRFSMRLAKMKGNNLDYQKKIKKLYAKRSRVFHSGHNDFNVDEVTFLEEAACLAIEEYINSPEKFTTEALDKNLLG